MFLSSQYIAKRAELLCIDCGNGVDILEPEEGSFDALESIRNLRLMCSRCSTCVVRLSDGMNGMCDLLIVRLAKLTRRSSPLTTQSENQLIAKLGELNDLIGKLRPLVANTSFALGILYKELADVYEVLGRMSKCVKAYKLLIPIVE